MALNKETITKMAALVGLSFDEFESKLKDEAEVSVDVPRLFSETEKTEFGTNRFEEGKTAMKEIQVKDLKELYPVAYTGKDLKKFMESFKVKALEDAKVAPDAKVIELEADISKLQTKLDETITEKEAVITGLKTTNFTLENNHKILGHIPESTIIPRNDIVTLFNTKHVVKSEDGNVVVEKDGVILKDDLAKPLSLKDVIGTFLDDNKYLSVDGMGGSNNGGSGSGKFTKLSEYMAYCEKNKIEPSSDEGQELLAKSRKENKEFVMDYE